MGEGLFQNCGAGRPGRSILRETAHEQVFEVGRYSFFRSSGGFFRLISDLLEQNFAEAGAAENRLPG